MRSISRFGFAAALTVALTLGVSGTAFGAGADDIRHDLTSAVSPNAQDNQEFGKAALYTQPTWYDNDNSPVVPAEGAEEIRIDFDDDIKITTKKLPTCDAATEGPGSLVTMTSAQAIDECGSSQIGAGAAKVRFAGFGALGYEASEADFTVTAFNGPKSTAGPATCTDDSAGGPYNCEWVGNKPVIYLHARLDALTQTSLVRGEIQSASDTLPGAGTPPITAGFGKRLAVTDGTDVSGDAGAVVLFNAVVTKSYKYKQGGETIKKQYISARCNQADDVDPAGAGINPGWKFKSHTVYDDDDSHSANAGNSEDTVQTYTNCGTK